MKKLHSYLAVFAALALVSCEQEPKFIDGNDYGLDLSKDGIAFTFGGNTITKSSDAFVSEKETGLVFSLGQDNSGSEYYLEEMITDLNGYGPETKGTPIYTKNVTKFYTSFGAVTYLEGQNWEDDPYIGNVSFESLSDTASIENNKPGWIYNHYYIDSPWPSNEKQNLYFYLRMPTDHLDSYSEGYAYGEDGSISFNYNTPGTGKVQKDILFAFRTLNKAEYMSKYRQTGAPVTFYHALTGVKFRSSNDNSGTTKTIITNVEITGLKSYGECTVEPNGTVTWENCSLPSSFNQEFANPTYDKTLADPAQNSDGSIKYDTTNVNFGGTSFVTGGKADKQNLNDTTGSLTFWFIPQKFAEMTDEEAANVQLKVTFVIKTPDTATEIGGGVITHTIADFGTRLKTAAVNWDAGQLRTYVLEPSDVDVAIFDTMKNWKKDSLHVTNTGNVDEYVRMMVVGNWYDGDGNILVGYKYAGNESLPDSVDINEMIVPWFREDKTEGYDYGSYFDDSFKYGRPNGTNWKRGTGSYYYYTEVIGAGDKLSGTESLFKTYDYTPKEAPIIYIPSSTSNVRVPAQGVHLVMEVVVQAIGTKKPDGTPYKDCWEAWSAATGEEIKEKPFKN